MSFMTSSKLPSGNHHCGETSIMVPPNPRGATPTTVNVVPFARNVLPTKPGEKLWRRHTAYDAMAAFACEPGRSSSAVNARPAASVTPSVLK